MQHPLENPTLTPFGLTSEASKERLDYKPMHNGVNRERFIAKLWAKRGRENATHPLPARTILQEILPSIATIGQTPNGDFMFEGEQYLTRDIVVLSTFVQWLATNVGNSFLTSSIKGIVPEREFLQKLIDYKQQGGCSLASFLLHEHNRSCTTESLFQNSGCSYDPVNASKRDQLVAEALMRWLSKDAGRSFIGEYQSSFLQALGEKKKSA